MSKAEEFIKKQSHIIENPTSVWISSYNARKAVKIAREEIYEWLRINLCNYFDAPRNMFDMCLEDLKQAIKDE